MIIHTADHAPAHVHIRRAGQEVARVQLDPVELWDSHGLSTREESEICGMVAAHQADLLAAWDTCHTSR